LYSAEDVVPMRIVAAPVDVTEFENWTNAESFV